MPIHRAGPGMPYSRPPPTRQVKKGEQERRMLTPKRVASTWQENIAARVHPRSENRWPAPSRPQSLLLTSLQLLMLTERIKSVVSLPEVSPRSTTPFFTSPVFSDTGDDTGSAPTSDLSLKPTLHRSAATAYAPDAGEQAVASKPDKLQRTPPAGRSFHFPGKAHKTASHFRQASAPNRIIRSVPEVSLGSAEPVWPVNTTTTNSVPKRQAADVFNETLPHQPLANRLEELDPAFLSDYLTQAGYADLGKYAGCAPAPKVLTALYRHLAPGGLVGGDPAGVARLDPQPLQRFMRHVMGELGFYGARDGQAIAPAFQRQVLTELISRWANGCLPTPGRIAGYSWPLAARQQRTVTQIKEEVASRLQRFGLPQEIAAWAGAMLLAGAEPALARADTPGDLHYGSLEWADLQTGIDLAASLEQDHTSMTYAELLALAQASDIAARQQPETAAQLLAPQIRTALVFSGMTPEAGDPQSEQRIEQAEQALSALHDARTARWETVQSRFEALATLEAPLPMRRRMALQNLADRNIDPHHRFLVDAGVRDPDIDQLPHPPVEEDALTLYLDGNGGLVDRSLPDVDQAFELAFTQYMSNCRQAVQTLFGAVIQALPEPDRSFWQQGRAQILTPHVALDLKGMPHLSQWPLRSREQSAIVAIRHHGEARHYLVSAAGNSTGNGDSPIRLLADDLPYQLDEVDHQRLDNILLPHADDLFTNAGDMKLARARAWNFRSDEEAASASLAIAQHFTRPIQALREQAYAPTANQQIEQAIRQTLLSLIPFHDCIGDVKDGNAGGAALSCGLDVVGLIPVIGAGIKLGVGAGKLSIRLGGAALVQLARNGLSRQTLHTLSLQLAAPLTRFGAKAGTTLVRSMAQWLDPGFALLGKMPAAARHAFMSTLRQWPDLKPLAIRIHASLRRLPYRFDAQAGFWRMQDRAVIHDGGRQFAQIDGHAFELIDLGRARRVPIVRIEEGSGGDARFALVDPRSGLAYGPQWVRTADGFETLGDYGVRLRGKIPAADQRGIIRFEQRDYIQVDGRHYPVRHDEDWNTWRIYKENNANGYPIPVRYDADLGAWRIHDDLGLRGGMDGVGGNPSSLTDLPDETIREIAHRLSDADIERFSQVNHRLHELLADERTGRRLLRQARQANSLEEFQALLRAPEEGTQTIWNVGRFQQERLLALLGHRIRAMPDGNRLTVFNLIHDAVIAAEFPIAHRAAPLTALARQIEHLPAGDRLRAFNLIHDDVTIVAFPLQRRAAPLAALARQSSNLPPELRWGVLHKILDAAAALPVQYRSDPLTAMAEEICFLPTVVEQWQMLNAIHAALGPLAERHRAAPLAALAEQLSPEFTELSQTQRRDLFNQFLTDTNSLAEQRLRAPPLDALAQLIPDLTGPGQYDAFSRALAATARLREQDRGAVLAILMRGIRILPSPIRRRAFDAALSTIGGLAAQDRSTALTALAIEIGHLPMIGQGQVFDALLSAIGRLAVHDRDTPLMSAARRLCNLPDEIRLDRFSRILAAVAELAVDDRNDALTTLARELAFLPETARQHAFGITLPAIAELAAQDRRLALETLTRNIRYLPEAVRRDAFDRILPELTRLAISDRGPLLEGLANQFPHLPEAERPSAFGRICREIVNIAETYRRQLLHILLQGIWRMPEAERLQAFRQFLPQIRLLPDYRRTQLLDRIVAARAGVAGANDDRLLEPFIRAIDTLPEELRYDAFTRAVAAIESLAVAQQPIAANALLEHLVRQLPALPLDRLASARRLVQETYMERDVRRHYVDSVWVDELALVPDPEGTPVVFTRVLPDATTERREYWTGSVQFGEIGNRNVLLEPVDAGGARRWYLVGRNGERLSQYLDRRYGGTLTLDATAPV